MYMSSSHCFSSQALFPSQDLELFPTNSTQYSVEFVGNGGAGAFDAAVCDSCCNVIYIVEEIKLYNTDGSML